MNILKALAALLLLPIRNEALAMTLEIRASRLPLAMVCPASMQSTSSYTLDTDGEAARLGTAVHEWLGQKIATQDIGNDEIFETLAIKYNLKADDVRSLSIRAWKLWREIEQWFPSPIVEGSLSKDLGPVRLTGHVDVMRYRPDTQTLFVNDHKTGWLDGDHSDQVKAYALMGLEQFPEAVTAHTCIMRVRDYSTDFDQYTRDQLAAWSERVVDRLISDRDKYHPGRHCSFCPRRLTCDAYRDWIRWAIEILTGSTVYDLKASTSPDPQTITDVYDAKSNLDHCIKEAAAVLKALALSSNEGTLKKTDGMQLQLVDQIQTSILFRQAWPILQKIVDEDFYNDVFNIDKGNLQKLVKLGAGHGQKGKAVAALMEQLEAAGAITENKITRLENRKAQP